MSTAAPISPCLLLVLTFLERLAYKMSSANARAL